MDSHTVKQNCSFTLPNLLKREETSVTVPITTNVPNNTEVLKNHP